MQIFIDFLKENWVQILMNLLLFWSGMFYAYIVYHRPRLRQWQDELARIRACEDKWRRKYEMLINDTDQSNTTREDKHE